MGNGCGTTLIRSVALVELRPASVDDRESVWHWANEARAWSKRRSPIGWDEHMAWWRHNWRRVWICVEAGEPIGYWRTNESGFVAVAIRSDRRGQGLAAALITSGAALEQRPLTAEVFEGNEASIRAFRRAGFDERDPYRRLVIMSDQSHTIG